MGPICGPTPDIHWTLSDHKSFFDPSVQGSKNKRPIASQSVHLSTMCLLTDRQGSDPFFDRTEKHKIVRGHWVLASYTVLSNSVQWFRRRSKKCFSQSEARRPFLFYDKPKTFQVVNRRLLTFHQIPNIAIVGRLFHFHVTIKWPIKQLANCDVNIEWRQKVHMGNHMSWICERSNDIKTFFSMSVSAIMKIRVHYHMVQTTNPSIIKIQCP